MTETQAKSGAAGASTDADDPSVEAPATSAMKTPDAAPRPTPDSASATGPAAIATGALSSTPVVVKSQTPTPTVVSPAPSAGKTDGKTEDPKTDPVKEAAKPSPVEPARTEPPKVGPAKAAAARTEPAKTEPPKGGAAKSDQKPADPDVDNTVPVTAVPANAASLNAPTITRDSRFRLGANRSAGATGTAPVNPAGPVVARAQVTTPSTTGARPFTGLTTATRPGVGQTAGVRVPETARPTRAVGAGANRGPRRARLHLKRIDPWSVMKFSFAVSLVLFVVAIVATAVLYLALDAMHVWSSINTALSDVTGQAGSPNDSFRITAKGVIGTAVLLGAVNMVLFTALMTLGAFVYNVCADLVGGIELTLSEKD
jgi:hypothetical protein